jgi:acetyl-CoA acetyltransferase
LAEELAPVAGALDCDEHPRPETTREALAALPPVFKENGLATAGKCERHLRWSSSPYPYYRI